MRILDIVVPHYSESWPIARPFFDLINAQKGVDFSQFRVWLVHDGVEPFPQEYFDQGPADIIQCRIPHKGVSAARNYGLDLADATWIAFCDCDDCYSSIYSLKMIFHILKQEQQFDLLWSPFYMNLLDPEETLIKKEKFNPVFIHNKYYRLSFLRERSIRFCEDLYFSEDSAFNAVVLMELGEHRIGSINVAEPLYLWCRRPGSITTDNTRWLRNTEGHLLRNRYVLEEIKKRNLDNCDLQVCRSLTDAFCMMVKWPKKEQMVDLKRKVAAFYRENEALFKGAGSEKFRFALQSSELEFQSSEKDIPGRPSFDEWLEDVLAT